MSRTPPRPYPQPAPARPLGTPLVAVVGSGDALVEAADLTARSIHEEAPALRVLLADFTLDGSLRAAHPARPGEIGLTDLAGPGARPGGAAATERLAGLFDRTPSGLAFVPGLPHHRDWIHLPTGGAERALGHLRSAADAVVVAVDPDLEGEDDTGSFDIEDRNQLARTAVALAGTVVSASTATRTGVDGQARFLRDLQAFGVPVERTWIVLAPPALRPADRHLRMSRRPWHGPRWEGRVVVLPHPTRTWARAPRQLASLASAVLAAPTCPSVQLGRSAGPLGELVLPGELGHWMGDEDAGWMMPNVPQHP